MNLENLFLEKEELPIMNNCCFEIPIHPIFLNENIKIDESIPHRIFTQVAEEWYEDLKRYVELEDEETVEWIKSCFLREKPKIINGFGCQRLKDTSWEDLVLYENNGFATYFSINRNSGGSLYFNRGDINCKTSIPNYLVKISKEKAKSFESVRIQDKSLAFVYVSHNIDSLPGALFLRNWVITYMNECFEQLSGQVNEII